MNSRRVAVIGSNSFSGSDFIDLLLEDPATEVLGVSRSPEKSRVFLPYLRHDSSRFRFLQADLNKHEGRLFEALDDFAPEYVVNFAAQSEVGPSWDHPEHWFQTNAVGLARFANRLKDRGYLRKYVHISSPEVYGNCVGNITETSPMNPSTPYAASKAAADMFLKTLAEHHDFPLVTIRATNVYGAHQQLFKIIPRTFINLRLGRTIHLHGGGKAVKSYIHIRDVSRGEEAAMLHGEPGQMYHLSPDDGIAVRDVVAKICALTDNDFDTATRATEERLGQDAAYVIDSSKARKAFSWRPMVDMEAGLRHVNDWINRDWNTIEQSPHEYEHTP